jgi:hypothetical protein
VAAIFIFLRGGLETSAPHPARPETNAVLAKNYSGNGIQGLSCQQPFVALGLINGGLAPVIFPSKRRNMRLQKKEHAL